MDTNLFENIEVKEAETKVNDFYQDVLTKRERVKPDLDGNISGQHEDIQAERSETGMERKTQVVSKNYNLDEVKIKSTEYFDGDDMAANVWINKYALKDSSGNIYEMTPDDMHRRIASELARIEKKYPNPLPYEKIFDLIKNFKYIIPQGSPMAGIGNNFQVASLSNCFVIGNSGNSDSYGGIMKIDQEQVQLMKRRGGVGHDLSHIRPAKSPVHNSALTSTGIVPFMERYSNSTREVAQDGRRGALMLSISIKHPDAEQFIDAKLVQGKVTGANVSVKIDDEFMRCVLEGRPYIQQYPINSENPTVVKETDAKALWNKIIRNAWKSAEPGVLFWDTIMKESIPDCYADLGFTTVSTNPCGEIPLCPYDSCRLLALNLYSYVEKPFTDQAVFNSEKFVEHVGYAQRLMDDIIDLESENIDKILQKIDSDPEPDELKTVERNLWINIKEKTLKGRRTGVGITAEGDMLAALGKRYGSDDAISFAVEVQQTLALEAYRSSVNMARERGKFIVYDAEREKNNPFILRLKNADPELYEAMEKYGRRNIALLTIAPTGSVSICSQTTSGIEPVFEVIYKRRRKVNPNDKDVKVCFVDEVGDSWEEYIVFHKQFLEWLKVSGYDVDAVKKYSDQEREQIIRLSPFYKATASDIDWVAKVKMQGAIQKWVDHSISVTVNVPEDTSEDIVADIYKTAWESGCKGMTIYRDKSRSGVLIANTKKDKEETEFKENDAPPRPPILDADVVRFQNDKVKWIAIVGLLNNKPYEIFTGTADDFFVPIYVTKGKVIRIKEPEQHARYDFIFVDRAGEEQTIKGLSKSFDKEYWNYAKLISGVLRHGMPLPFVVDLIGNLTLDNDSINTWKNGVVRALKKYIPDGTVKKGEKCNNCGAEGTMIYKEGCMTCDSCGDSKCG